MIGIITYDAPHRKTQDVLSRLKLEGYSDLELIVLPWVARENFKPIFVHRPSARVELSIAELSDRLALKYMQVSEAGLNQHLSERNYRHVIIAGAGILPAEAAREHKIINAHPGYLPVMKGLDALKWAIYQNAPIGVTSHYISDKADEGELIERREIPVYKEDTFHSLAYRVYETEIEMLTHAIKMLDEGKASLSSLADDQYIANRRMPNKLEFEMIQKFEQRRNQALSRFNL